MQSPSDLNPKSVIEGAWLVDLKKGITFQVQCDCASSDPPYRITAIRNNPKRFRRATIDEINKAVKYAINQKATLTLTI